MYNGIGLQTPRGSGTNGHVQRNWAIIRKTKDKCEYKADERLDQLNKPPNQEILDHVRKRKVEVKCAEFADILEDQGSTSDEIKTKVAAYRELLMENDTYSPIPTDEFGRTNVRETHQVAEAQQEKNAKLRKAFGISEFFIEGSSLDRERHAREAEARAAATQIYELVPSPSTDPVSGAAAVVSEKKITHKRSASSSKKKKGKKHKKDRSESPKISKKKDKSKKKKKEKEKKHKKAEVTSSESNSSDDSDNSSSSEAESKKKKKKRKKKSRNDNEKDKPEKKKAATKRKSQYSESSSNFSSERIKKTSTQAKLLDKMNIDTTLRESRQTYSLKLKQVRSHVKTPSPTKPKESSAKQIVFDIKGKSQYEELTQQYTTGPQAPLKQNDRRSMSRNRDDRGRSPRKYSKSRRSLLPSPRRKRISKSPRRVSRYTVSRSRSRSRCNRYRGGSRRRHSPLRRNRSCSRKRSPKRSRNYSARSRNRRNSRSRTRSRSRRSSLSYSPVRRNPDRYKDLLDDKKQYRKSEVTKLKSRSVSRGKKTPIIPPRVSLRSSSEEETEILDDYPKQQEDEVRQNEINTLKRLQSGLAAKARETLGKKIICPIIMKTEKKDECILDIALPVELPKTTIINDQSMKLQEKPESKSPIDLNPLKSVESSRSPSPALPLTREEAMYPSSIKPAKIVVSPIETATSEERTIKLRSPMESPPFFLNELNNSSSRSPSPTAIRKKNPINKNTFYPRSASRSYSRSVSQETTELRLSRNQDSSKDKTSGFRSQDKKSESPMLLSRSPSRTKESLRSRNSRSSKSSSQSKCSISRSRSRSKRPNSCSPNKLRSRSSTRSVSQSHSPSKKSYTHSRSVSRTSRDNQKRSPSRSSSNSSRRGSFSSSSRSSTSGSSRSSRSTSSSSESNRSRSPSIPRRHGSPSFLDRRRITS
ncbi:hypothetical protein PV328_007842 [Microctonus aethiopoides]|nr:hypothetical protein PV328_007842 [Microctonus aethiopoides]